MQLTMTAQGQQTGTTESFMGCFPVKCVGLFWSYLFGFAPHKMAVICSLWHTDLDHTAGLLLAVGLLNLCGVRTELGLEARGFREPYLRSVEAMLWQTWLPGGQDLTPGAGSLWWDWEGGEQGNWRCNQSVRSNGSHLFRRRGFSFCLVQCRLLGNQIWVFSLIIHEDGTNNVETRYWLFRSMQIHSVLRLF